jgi:hypothetical protein
VVALVEGVVEADGGLEVHAECEAEEIVVVVVVEEEEEEIAVAVEEIVVVAEVAGEVVFQKVFLLEGVSSMAVELLANVQLAGVGEEEVVAVLAFCLCQKP